MQHHNRTTISVETRQGQFIAHTNKKYSEVTSLCLTPLPLNFPPYEECFGLVWFSGWQQLQAASLAVEVATVQNQGGNQLGCQG